ncbi:unnamed protein product, partial [Discosporangium mesarthrocarpum]
VGGVSSATGKKREGQKDQLSLPAFSPPPPLFVKFECIHTVEGSGGPWTGAGAGSGSGSGVAWAGGSGHRRHAIDCQQSLGQVLLADLPPVIVPWHMPSPGRSHKGRTYLCIVTTEFTGLWGGVGGADGIGIGGSGGAFGSVRELSSPRDVHPQWPWNEGGGEAVGGGGSASQKEELPSPSIMGGALGAANPLAPSAPAAAGGTYSSGHLLLVHEQLVTALRGHISSLSSAEILRSMLRFHPITEKELAIVRSCLDPLRGDEVTRFQVPLDFVLDTNNKEKSIRRAEKLLKNQLLKGKYLTLRSVNHSPDPPAPPPSGTPAYAPSPDLDLPTSNRGSWVAGEGIPPSPLLLSRRGSDADGTGDDRDHEDYGGEGGRPPVCEPTLPYHPQLSGSESKKGTGWGWGRWDKATNSSSLGPTSLSGGGGGGGGGKREPEMEPEMATRKYTIPYWAILDIDRPSGAPGASTGNVASSSREGAEDSRPETDSTWGGNTATTSTSGPRVGRLDSLYTRARSRSRTGTGSWAGDEDKFETG